MVKALVFCLLGLRQVSATNMEVSNANPPKATNTNRLSPNVWCRDAQGTPLFTPCSSKLIART